MCGDLVGREAAPDEVERNLGRKPLVGAHARHRPTRRAPTPRTQRRVLCLPTRLQTIAGAVRGLHQFDQHAAGVLGVQEVDRRPGRAAPRLVIQGPDPGRPGRLRRRPGRRPPGRPAVAGPDRCGRGTWRSSIRATAAPAAGPGRPSPKAIIASSHPLFVVVFPVGQYARRARSVWKSIGGVQVRYRDADVVDRGDG